MVCSTVHTRVKLVISNDLVVYVSLVAVLLWQLLPFPGSIILIDFVTNLENKTPPSDILPEFVVYLVVILACTCGINFLYAYARLTKLNNLAGDDGVDDWAAFYLTLTQDLNWANKYASLFLLTLFSFTFYLLALDDLEVCAIGAVVSIVGLGVSAMRFGSEVEDLMDYVYDNFPRQEGGEMLQDPHHINNDDDDDYEDVGEDGTVVVRYGDDAQIESLYDQLFYFRGFLNLN